MVSPNVRMQPGGYNPELTSQSWGENLRVNLPKLQLPVFDGNLQQWHEFWNIYKATIHDQQTLPAVSKFSYLKGLFKGSALSAIAGISLTSENYSSVIKLLQEKFGRKEAIVESLYIPSYKIFRGLVIRLLILDGRVKLLRKFQDSLKLRVNSLMSRGR